MEPTKTLPFSLEAEQALLSCLLRDPKTVGDLLSSTTKITKEAFSDWSHQLIFEIIMKAINRGRPVDLITLKQSLVDVGHLNSIGGEEYLNTLYGYSSDDDSVEEYARIVRDKAVRRKLIVCSQKWADDCQKNQAEDVAPLIETIEKDIFTISQTNHSSDFSPISDIASVALERIQALHNAGGQITGLGTGLRELDEITNGLQKSDMIIWAARPSMGKTALVMLRQQGSLLPRGKRIRHTGYAIRKGVQTINPLTNEAAIGIGLPVASEEKFGHSPAAWMRRSQCCKRPGRRFPRLTSHPLGITGQR
jgi:replicative DNA helicase